MIVISSKSIISTLDHITLAQDICARYWCFSLLTILLLNITVLYPPGCQLWRIARVWSWWFISMLTIRTEKGCIDNQMSIKNNNMRHKKSTYSIFVSNWGRSGRDWVKLKPQQQVEEYHIQKMKMMEMMMMICSRYVLCWNMCGHTGPGLRWCNTHDNNNTTHTQLLVSQRFYKFEIFFNFVKYFLRWILRMNVCHCNSCSTAGETVTGNIAWQMHDKVLIRWDLVMHRCWLVTGSLPTEATSPMKQVSRSPTNIKLMQEPAAVLQWR